MEPNKSSRSFPKTIAALIVIVIIIVAGTGVYFASISKPTPTGITSSSGVTSSSSVPAVLTVDEPAPPTTADPGAAIDNDGLELAQNTNLPLMFCANAMCTSMLPLLATSWTESTDGLAYTFNLRNDVYYSNGDPFNAYVVWYNIYRDLYINQPAGFIFYTYFNTAGVTVGDVNSLNTPSNEPTGNSTLLGIMRNPTNSVTVLNTTAVQFHLTSPFVAFLQSIVTSPWVFVDPYTVQQHGGVLVNQPSSWMAVNGTAVGDGPYITQTYMVNQYAILVSNPHYWAENITDNIILQPAKIGTIVINYKTNELTRTEDLQSNTVQGSVVSSNDIANVLAACKSCVIPNTGPSGTVEWIAINAKKAPTDNLLVRQAIVAAINLTEIQAAVYQNYIQSVNGPMPATFQYYNSSILPPAYDQAKAKALLAEAGYPNGQGFPTINFVYAQGTYEALVAQIVKQDLAAIGIPVEPHEVAMDELVNDQAIPGNSTGSPYMYMYDWTYYPDFAAYEYIVDSSMGVFGNFYNETVHNLILKSNTELNPTLRAEEISQITYDVQQQAAYVWLGQDLDLYDTGGGVGPIVWSNCVAGLWYNTAFNGVDFNSVYYTCTPS